MVKVKKECEGKYIAFNDETGACVDIIEIYQYNQCGECKLRYKIDYQGNTKIILPTLVEARSYARKLTR